MSVMSKLKIFRTWALALLCFSIAARCVFMLGYKLAYSSPAGSDYVVLIPVGLVTAYLGYLFVVTARRESKQAASVSENRRTT